MEENNKVEVPVMSTEDFTEKYINSSLNLRYFDCVRKFKSVNRAFKKGYILSDGTIAPKRPFNNRKNTSKRKGVHSRGMNELKKQVHEEVKNYQGRI